MNRLPCYLLLFAIAACAGAGGQVSDALAQVKGMLSKEEKQRLVGELIDAAEGNQPYARSLLAAHPEILDAPLWLMEETALHFMAVEDFTKGVKFLLENGADPNVPSGFGHTALIDVAGNGNLEIVNILLKYGANPNATSTVQCNALHWSLNHSESPAIIDALIAAGADTSYVTDTGENIFSALPDKEVLATAYLEVFRKHGLIKRINEEVFNGSTPLVEATQFDYHGLMRALLKAGADPNLETKNGLYTPLTHAAQFASCSDVGTEAVRILLQAGADPNKGCSDGLDLPLHLAVEDGSVEVVRLLLQAGAKPGQLTEYDETAYDNLPDDPAKAKEILALLKKFDQP